MRLSFIFIFAALMQVSASSLAQKITLSERQATLETILQKIRIQTGYDFLYDVQAIKAAKPIDINVRNSSLADALNSCLAGQDFSFTIDDKSVIIKRKEPSLLHRAKNVILNLVQDLTIKGRVVDQDGKPLPNASIRVKGKSAVTNTNAEGEFEIKGVDEDAVLLVSFVGFKTLEIRLKDAVMPLEIKLNVATGELEEVKVVYNTGYQELNKERATGSFVQIDNELFNRKVSTNIMDRILEVTSGLSSTKMGRRGNSTLAIRGISTINGGSNPLIVIDNFPYEGDINNINPNDIESVTVLKDAAAASIWGVRAGNGVIVLRTKTGRYNQRSMVSLTTNISIGQKPDLFYIPTISSADVIDFEIDRFQQGEYNTYDDLYPQLNLYPVLPQVAEMLLKARRDGIVDPVNDPNIQHQLALLKGYDIRNDLNKYFLRKTINQQYAINLSGGGDVYKYYAAVGYDKNQLRMVGNSENRLTISINNTWNPLKDLEITGGINYTRSNSSSKASDFTSLLLGSKVSPYTRLADDNGNPLAIPFEYRMAYVDTASYPALLDWHYRPLEEVNLSSTSSKQSQARLTAGVKYKLLPDIDIEAQYQLQNGFNDSNSNNNENSHLVRSRVNMFMNVNPIDKKPIYPYPIGNFMSLTRIESTSWVARGQLNIDKAWKKHRITAVTGMEIRELKSDGNSFQIIGFDEELNSIPTVDLTTPIPTRPDIGLVPIGANVPILTGSLNRNGSTFANIGYTYNDRYLFTASARRDQSNFFGIKANNRHIPLWSTGVAWILSQERFFKFVWLDNLKLRITYGFNGNTLNDGSHLPLIRYRPSSFILPTGVAYAEIAQPANPELKWEKIRTTNFGLDFSLLKRRLSGSFEYYTKKGIDLLGPIEKDPTTGVTKITSNRASFKGKGIDVILNLLITNNKFRWTQDFLFNYNKDKVTEYQNPNSNLSAFNYLGQTAAVVVGLPLSQLSSFKWAGLDPLNGTPRIYLGDTVSNFNNASKGTPTDIIYNGTTAPLVFGSFRNTFSWNQLTLSLNIVYKLNYFFRRNSIDYGSLYGNWREHADYRLRWQKTGDEAFTNVPSLPKGGGDNRDIVYRNSNILIEKGDHIRLQDIRISYSLNKILTRQSLFQNMQFYFYANNLPIVWRANKYKIDPEAYSYGSLPNPTQFSFGITANF